MHLETVPVGVPHTGHLPDLGGNYRQMPLGEPGDVDTDVQRTRRPVLCDHTAWHDVEGLKTGQDARKRSRIGLSADAQAKRLRCRLYLF